MTDTVQVVFFKNTGIAAKLIRWFTFSRWNHAGIRVAGVYFESTFIDGVTARQEPRPMGSSSDIEVVDVSVSTERAKQMAVFLNGQLGKAYDWRAIFALPWRRRWQSPKAWFCSELVAEALRIGGVNAVKKLDSYRVTPRDLWLTLPS